MGNNKYFTRTSRRHQFDFTHVILGILMMTSATKADRNMYLRNETRDRLRRKLPPVRENGKELPTLLTPSLITSKVSTPTSTPTSTSTLTSSPSTSTSSTTTTLTPTQTQTPIPFPASSYPSYSSEPSTSPSMSPSGFPSIALSDVPSLPPSSKPSFSLLPTRSQGPSISPSNFPSLRPSLMPTNFPSSNPTQTPTAFPSIQPSTKPTNTPSKLPTMLPSETPTISPTSSPSSVPTNFPSSSPTNECHDNQAYVSPINMLSCEDHKNTPCTEWRFIGLNGDQVADLIENCPVSCGIECGSFTRVNMEYSYILSYVPETLGPTQEEILESTSKAFFSSYVDQNEANGIFIIYDVSFRSREILSNRRLVSPIHMRRSLSGIAQLKVTVKVSGHSIGLPTESLETLLERAVESSEFEQALRRSDPFFSTVRVSWTRRQIPAAVVNGNTKEEQSDKAFPATVIVSVLAAVTVFGVLFATFAYKGRSQRSTCHVLLPGLSSFTAKLPPRLLVDVSTDATEHDHQPRDRIFSFGESPGGSAQTIPVTNGLMRLLGSLSSRSHNSTSSCSSECRSSEVDNAAEKEERPREHPLAGIIPPMLLIDIEDAETEFKSVGSEVSQEQAKEMMPIKHVEASSELLEALSNVQDLNKPISLSEILSYTNGKEGESPGLETSQQVLPKLMMDFNDEDSEKGSVASTPVAMTLDEDHAFFHRKVASFSALDEIQPSNTLDDLIRSQWDDVATVPLEDETTPANAVYEQESDYLSETTSPEMKSKTHCLTETTAPEMQSKTLPQVRAIACMTPTRASLAALAKTFRKFRSASNDSNVEEETNVQNKPDDIDLDKCTTPRVSDGLTAIDVAHSMSSSYSSTDHNSIGPANGESLHSFEAPCSGKLGLIIESSSNTGPTIHTVKDYSPLFGLVRAGDKIVRVGSKTTKHMSTDQITKLLAQKRGKQGNDVMKIKVARPAESMSTPAIPQSPITPSCHFREVEQNGHITPSTDDTRPRTQIQLSTNTTAPLVYQIVKEKPKEEETSFHLIGACDNYDEFSDESDY